MLLQRVDSLRNRARVVTKKNNIESELVWHSCYTRITGNLIKKSSHATGIKFSVQFSSETNLYFLRFSQVSTPPLAPCHFTLSIVNCLFCCTMPLVHLILSLSTSPHTAIQWHITLSYATDCQTDLSSYLPDKNGNFKFDTGQEII